MGVHENMWECTTCGDYNADYESVCPYCAKRYGSRNAVFVSFEAHKPTKRRKITPPRLSIAGCQSNTAECLKAQAWLSMDFGSGTGHFSLIHF